MAYKILGTLTDQFDRAKGKANAEDTLAKYPDIGCMVGLFAYNPPLMLEALEPGEQTRPGESRRLRRRRRHARGNRNRDRPRNGRAESLHVRLPSVEVLAELANGNTSVIPADKFIDIPARQIRKETVGAFWDDLKKKTGK